MSYNVYWKVSRTVDVSKERTLVLERLRPEALARGFVFQVDTTPRSLILVQVRRTTKQPYPSRPMDQFATCTRCLKVLSDHLADGTCLFAYKSKWHHKSVRYGKYLLYEDWITFHACVNDVLDGVGDARIGVATDHGGGGKSGRVDVRMPGNLRRDDYDTQTAKGTVYSPRYAEWPEKYFVSPTIQNTDQVAV